MFMVSAEDLAKLKCLAQQGLPDGHWISSQVRMSIMISSACKGNHEYIERVTSHNCDDLAFLTRMRLRPGCGS